MLIVVDGTRIEGDRPAVNVGGSTICQKMALAEGGKYIPGPVFYPDASFIENPIKSFYNISCPEVVELRQKVINLINDTPSNDSITLVGHSRGGSIVVSAASFLMEKNQLYKKEILTICFY